MKPRGPCQTLYISFILIPFGGCWLPPAGADASVGQHDTHRAVFLFSIHGEPRRRGVPPPALRAGVRGGGQSYLPRPGFLMLQLTRPFYKEPLGRCVTYPWAEAQMRDGQVASQTEPGARCQCTDLTGPDSSGPLRLSPPQGDPSGPLTALMRCVCLK